MIDIICKHKTASKLHAKSCMQSMLRNDTYVALHMHISCSRYLFIEYYISQKVAWDRQLMQMYIRLPIFREIMTWKLVNDRTCNLIPFSNLTPSELTYIPNNINIYLTIHEENKDKGKVQNKNTEILKS